MQHSVQEIRLKNGSRGLLIDVPGASVVNYKFQFRAGDLYVADRAKYETAHIMEHMAFGANEKFSSAQEFSAIFQENGAESNAFTGQTSLAYVAECADFEWERILDLQELSITKPRFLKDDLLAESGNVQEELTGYLSSNPRVLWQRMWQESGYNILSDEERLATIKQISQQDIAEHHRRTHTSQNMRFIIAGNLKEKQHELIKKLEKWQLPKGSRFALPKEVVKAAAPVSLVRQDIPNVIFGLAFSMNQHIDDESLDAMSALNHILTGTMHSRILGEARKRGLCYGMWSDIDSDAYISEWSFGGQVSATNLDPLFKIIISELQNVAAGKVTEKELAGAKRYALGKHQMNCQTVGQLVRWYGNDYLYDDTIDNFDETPDKINAVTVEKITKLVRRFLKKPQMVVGGIGSVDADMMATLDKKIKTALAEV